VIAYLTPLIQFQRFILPVLVCLVLWAIWRTAFQKDMAVGLVLYIGLVVVVDGYLNTGVYLPGIDKGSIRYSEICALVLLWNGPAAIVPGSLYGAISRLVWLYFLLLFVSALRAESAITGLFEFRRLIISQILAFAVARRGLPSRDAYRRFFQWLTALVILIALFIFFDLFFDRMILKSDTLDNGVYWHNRAQGRFGAFFFNPNFLGAFVVLVFPPAFVWMLNEQRPKQRIYAITGLLALVFCLVETQSRAPLLAFGIAIVLLVLGPSGDVSRARRLSFLAVFIALFAVLMPGFYAHAVQRFDSIDTEMSASYGRSRETTWRYTARMINDHPLQGIGFGEAQFMKFMDAYGFHDQFGMESLDAPHNSYLQAAVYAGVPALIALVLANVLLLAGAGARLLRRVADDYSSLAFGLAVGVSGFLASIYTDLQLFTVTVAPIYWVVFGLLLSLVGAATKSAVTPAAVASRTSDLGVSWWSANRPTLDAGAGRPSDVPAPLAAPVRPKSASLPLVLSARRVRPNRMR
jgi:O-antigen ligase